MDKIGIICEYNPFHNGHVYHIEKVKELFPNSIIILVLNGYFLERGDVSILSKKDKTIIALNNGIDLVLELPFVFGTQSADIFASNALKILNNMECNYLVFGSETDDISYLEDLVKYTINNKEEYNNKIKEYLNIGLNYPTALSKALNTNKALESNDLLGFSYIKAIYENNYNIKPISIKRTNNYLDTNDNNKVISANNIREKLKNNIDIKKYLPKESYNLINNINLNNYVDIIKYKIIIEKDLSKYLDVNEGIDNLLKKVIYKVNSVDELLDHIKSKRYTYNKLRRMLVHILIGLTKEDNKLLTLDYIKVLGFNNIGKKYLQSIKKNLVIPLKVNKNSLIYQYELKSAYIYDLINKTKTKEFELNNKPIKINVK